MAQYLLSLTAFVFLILIFSILRTLQYNRRISFPAYCAIFVFFCGYSVLIVKNYTSPAKRILSNVDYHDVEHLGFRFANNKTIYFSSSDRKEESLFPNYSGNLKISPVDFEVGELSCSQFNLPVYVSTSALKRDDKLSSPSYVLINPLSDIDCSNGLTISVNDHTYKLLFNTGDDKYRFWNGIEHVKRWFSKSNEWHPTVEFVNDGIPVETDTCVNVTDINYGLPLSYFFRETKFPISEDVLDELSKYVLLRDTVYSSADKKNNSKLILQQIEKPINGIVSFHDLLNHEIKFHPSIKFKKPVHNGDLLYIVDSLPFG